MLMKTKNWIVLLCALLLLCAGLSVFLLRPRAGAAFAEISSQGQVLKTVDLAKDQSITVETPQGGVNNVTVQAGKIAVTEANCPDQVCVNRGWCGGGTAVVCLPNRLVIRFLGDQELDAVVG